MKCLRFASGGGLLLGLAALANPAGAIDVQKFEVHSNADLVALCAVPPTDPDFKAAINFCHGFAIGFVRYHDALKEGADFKPLYCFPKGLTPNQLIDSYIRYSKAHPQYDQEAVGDVFTKFLIDSFPCATDGGTEKPRVGK